MIFRKFSEILQEKEEIAQKKLKDAKPVVVISLKEGILIFTANPDLRFNKIYKVYDRIASVISGYRPDFKKVYRPLRFATENWANIYSEGDIVLRELADELASFLKERYENPGAITPYIVNMVLVEVAPSQNDDILIRIDFKGDSRDFDSYLVLSSNGAEKAEAEKIIKKYLKENYSAEKIFSDIAKQDKELRQANEGRLEAVFLNRRKAVEKDFDNVFQRKDRF